MPSTDRCGAIQNVRTNVHTCTLSDPHDQHACICGRRWPNTQEAAPS